MSIQDRTSYAKYISTATSWKEAHKFTDYSNPASIQKMFRHKGKLYGDIKSLFAVIILFPETLMDDDSSGNFNSYDVRFIRRNQQLFDEMAEYFVDSPLGNIADIGAIEELMTE